MTETLAALFEGIRDTSLTAAWAAGLVFLARLLLKGRAPRRALCLLWLVVFARLLLPVKLESPVSLVPPALSQNASVGRGLRAAPSGQSPQTADRRAGSSRPAPTNDDASVGRDGLAAPYGQSPQTADRRAGSSRPTPADGDVSVGRDGGITPNTPSTSPAGPDGGIGPYAWVWLAGTVGMLGRGLAAYVRLRRRVRLAVRVADRVWEDENVASPFILGLFRPRVYLPTGLEGSARRFILCHEFAHLRRLDHIVKPVCWFALALHWFNPAVWTAFLLLSRDMEAACDEAVLRSLGEEVKAGYSYTLLALASGKRIPAPCPLAFDEGDAKGRIKNVLNYRKPALWIVVVSVVAVIVAAVCLLTDPAAEKPDDTNSPATSVGPDDPIGPTDDPIGPTDDPIGPSEPSPTQSTGRDEVIAPYGADPWMLEVLKGERAFSVSGTDLDIGSLTQAFFGDDPPENLGLWFKLALLDLDRDGADELVLRPEGAYDDTLIYQTGYMILRREGDTVRGCAPGWRSIGDLKADGTFHWSGSAAYHGIGRARFEGGEFVGEPITWCDGSFETGETNYYVEGQPATEEEFNAAIEAQDAKPEPVWYVFQDGELVPVDGEAWKDLVDVGCKPYIPIPVDPAVNISVPSFLDMDQKRLYQEAYTLYSHIFGANTESIDEWEWSGSEPLPPAEPVEVDGYTYVPSTGLFAKWEDLETAALSVFTPAFWQARNTWLDDGGNPHQTFVNVDGRTYYLDASRGSHGTNPNFPDTFHLPVRSDTEITFVLTGHYSEVYPLEGESFEDRDARLADHWEEYIGFPMKLVKTENGWRNGWRFDEFHVAGYDHALLPYANQAAPNPTLTDHPEPEGGACVHGLDHVFIDHLTDGRLVYRCMEDFFPYYPPYPCAYGSESIAEGDYDGDGHIEEIVRSSAGTLMLCDVVPLDGQPAYGGTYGEMKTCTLDPRALTKAYPDADISTAWIEPGDKLFYYAPLRKEPGGDPTGTVRWELDCDGTALTGGIIEMIPADSPWQFSGA